MVGAINRNKKDAQQDEKNNLTLHHTPEDLHIDRSIMDYGRIPPGYESTNANDETTPGMHIN